MSKHLSKYKSLRVSPDLHEEVVKMAKDRDLTVEEIIRLLVERLKRK